MDRNPTITLTATQVLAGTGGFDLTALGSDGSYGIHVGNSDGSAANVSVNFGQDDFEDTPPTGYLDWGSNTATAPEFQGIDYFDSTLYEGNGTGQRVGDFVPFTDLYTVDNSIIVDEVTKNHLQRTMSAAASDSNKKFTLSVWMKRADITHSYSTVLMETTDGGGGNAAGIRVNTTAYGNLDFHLYAQGTGNSGSTVSVYADTTGPSQTSSWSHFLCQVDTTLATSADRVKLYIDGVLQNVVNASGAAANFPDQGSTFAFGTNLFPTQIGKIPYTSGFNSMYLAEHAFVTGTNSTSKSVSDYGALDTATNRWVAKDISGFTFGHNGSYLEFQTTPGSGSGAGTDTSGNSNNWAEYINGSASAWSSFTNFKMIDTPSKNYSTINPKTISGKTYSEGNLKVTSSSTFGQGNVLTNFPLSKGGKWYWEILDAAAAANQTYGIAKADSAASSSGLGNNTSSWGFYNQQYRHGGNIGAVPDSPTNAGTRYMFAVDVDAGKFWIGTDGTFWKPVGGSTAGNPANGTNPAFTDGDIAKGDTFPAMDLWSSDSATFVHIGSRFAHTAPTGFLELNQDNLDDTQSKLTAWAWIKNRDAADNSILIDRVRGVGNDLHSNDPAAEAFNENTVQRFLQRGVQVGRDVEVNTANESYVLWQWLLGDSATTGSTNDDGSVDTTVIAADAGHFSIVKGTTGSSGATFGHGLGAAPDFIINKDLTSAGWLVYSSAFASVNNYIQLNATSSVFTGSTVFGTAPTSTVFTLASFFNTVECINYCFRSVPGVCHVGGYIGNGSSDGPYSSIGFTPRWVMIKKTSGSGSWHLYDTARSPINEVDDQLLADSTAAETTGSEEVDILADGFKIRTADSGVNTSSGTYIYLAMADIGGNGTLPPIYAR